MEPFMAYNDKTMFYKYLDNASNYLEYGSGGSTYQSSLRQNINSIYSIESDLEWHNKLKNIIQNKNNIQFIYCDMNTQPNNWGHPGPNSTLNDWKRYNGAILNIDKSLSSKIDLILIDGRFRVACCLKCFDVINDNCLIAFDDFLDRDFYHIVLNYYDIIEKTEDNRMVILKKNV